MDKSFDHKFILNVSENGSLFGSVRFDGEKRLVRNNLSLPVNVQFDSNMVIGSAKLTQTGSILMLQGKLTDYGLEKIGHRRDNVTWAVKGNYENPIEFRVTEIAILDLDR